jgi:L-threonylcarbamoyladenylate synthase
MELDEVIGIIKCGGIGVLPTDTLYGLVAKADDKKAVERLYEVKKRPKDKPFIILIEKIKDLQKFGIELSRYEEKKLKEIWPNPVTVIFPLPSKKFEYLTRGSGKIAIRVPNDVLMQKILAKSGPLVAPSANISDEPPAEDIKQAEKYFGKNVDFYYGTKKKELQQPSTIIEYKGREYFVIREGVYKL